MLQTQGRANDQTCDPQAKYQSPTVRLTTAPSTTRTLVDFIIVLVAGPAAWDIAYHFRFDRRPTLCARGRFVLDDLDAFDDLNPRVWSLDAEDRRTFGALHLLADQFLGRTDLAVAVRAIDRDGHERSSGADVGRSCREV